MMKIIKDLLIKIINDIDTGNSNLSADECNKVIEYLTEITNKNEKLSKYQACKYLKVSRATFDNYVRAGKIPKGRKQIGFKELYWYKKDLIFYRKRISNELLITDPSNPLRLRNLRGFFIFIVTLCFGLMR